MIVQAQILDLLRSIRKERELTIVLISHDLGVVTGLADRVCVLYAGRIVEQGDVDDIYHRSRHPYTRGLLAAVPRPTGAKHRRLTSFEGAAPSLLRVPTGCAFQPRCPRRAADCLEADPRLRPVGSVQVACHHAEDLDVSCASDRS
nr:oligopeptide/dipeptide ABC transporter ATP-binding protein [Pseudonocardia kunmingensis]